MSTKLIIHIMTHGKLAKMRRCCGVIDDVEPEDAIKFGERFAQTTLYLELEWIVAEILRSRSINGRTLLVA